MPGTYFRSNNNAFHLAFLAWRYNTILSQPGAALEYLETHLHLLRCMPRYTPNPTYWKAQTPSDMDYTYQISFKIDTIIGHCQLAMSLLWHNVWLLQNSPASTNTKLKYTKPDECEMIGRSIAYWLDKLDYGMNIPRHVISILYVICDELCHQRDKLRQIDAMHRQEVRRSSPSPPIPTTHKRGEESKSMSVVSASSSSAVPLTLLSQIHSTRARMGAVTTQSVNVKHTDKLPPPDASPRRYEKSSSSPPPPISSTQERGAETKSMTVMVSAPSPSAAPLALSSRLHSTQARTGAVPTPDPVCV